MVSEIIKLQGKALEELQADFDTFKKAMARADELHKNINWDKGECDWIHEQRKDQGDRYCPICGKQPTKNFVIIRI